MTINFKGNEISLKYGIRAMIMFENIVGESVNKTNLESMLTLFYCILVSSSKDYNISFEDFVDWIDEDTKVLNEFIEWFVSISNNQNKLKKD